MKEQTRMGFASSTRSAENRTRWKGVVVKSFMVPPKATDHILMQPQVQNVISFQWVPR